jgi:ADP-heptose:LPS heptosyltransferase
VRLFSSDYEDASPHLYVTKQTEQWAKNWIADRNRAGFPIFAISPGAGHPDKRWPIDGFLEIAEDLTKRDFVPLFIFGPKENELHQSCAEAIKNQGYLIFKSDNYQVQPLAGILRHCSMLLTNDCAVMHVGAAIGCRVLAIFGPTNPDVWFPYSKPGQIAIGGSRPQKPSCPFPTVSEVQEVLNQISVQSAFGKTSCVET